MAIVTKIVAIEIYGSRTLIWLYVDLTRASQYTTTAIKVFD